ncbi:hypothetical protein HNP84_007161 [Thermocatellispora tengchongensis]|uniref:Bacterial Pleckstrin homology domain-containing protein n=1 Tax=Thermocatellispora tengchongensis TaxID=1073253 RepID=A0A840PEK5_9ACTN|nr:hypothetical protein [Thermocatellispora tengchongensis]MBB5137409.1 hypothetical protein [Thermocatellispora tengchongensis]
MASVTLHRDALSVRFTFWERPFALRGALTIPLTTVRHVTDVERPLRKTRGMRRAGVLVTGLLKIGSWGPPAGARQFVCARRGVPALHIALDPGTSKLGYDELLISTTGAAQVAAAISEAKR